MARLRPTGSGRQVTAAAFTLAGALTSLTTRSAASIDEARGSGAAY